MVNWLLLGCALLLPSCTLSKTDTKIEDSYKDDMDQKEITGKHVQKHTLDNGMTILVREAHAVPKVSIQLWYNVGSKDEKDGEKGIAHLIEHMIFKGTEKLSESDINAITQLLSGSCNAFTSYDYTSYVFNVPTHNWKQLFPVMSDCMQNISFKDEHLNSEMKAVIQELKMNRDNYARSMILGLIGAIFPDHPYHYPTIGYKQDLWDVVGNDLRKFYKKHYMPNNATLVVVGDVDANEVFNFAQEHFGDIEPNPDYKKEKFYCNKDVLSRSITLYREVEQPLAVAMYAVPGSYEKKDYIVDIAQLVLGGGKSSRLYKKIVDELQLATSLSVGSFGLFDHGVFYIVYEPKGLENISEIERVIQQEIDAVADHGPDLREVERAVKQARMQFYGMLENTYQQAMAIGKNYLATGDEEYIFHYLEQPVEQLAAELQEFLGQHFRVSVMHKGLVAPLAQRDKDMWMSVQKISDELDNKIMSARVRETQVEPPVYAKEVKPGQPGNFVFPKPQMLTLNNGIKVLYHPNDNTPKVTVVLDLRAKHFYDPDDAQGLSYFMSRMLSEGTENYTAAEFADALESRGMSFSVSPGGVVLSMLNTDFEKGLELLEEVVSRAVFDEKELEKVREQILVDIKGYWDEPREFSKQLIKEQIYKGHPYSKNQLGTKESVAKMKRQDLVDFYKKYVSPSGAKIAIVGNIEQHNLQDVLERTIGKWHGPEVEEIKFPPLAQVQPAEINYPINRDQVVLAFVGRSIERKHPDYDKLVLFDQIFGGGVLHSMSSRLFQLREQSGLFYTIGGTLVAHTDLQPGMVLVKTIVSLDNLALAEKAILGTIDTAANTIHPQEFAEAKNAIINSLAYNFESNGSMANAFLFLDKYELPHDYFDTRARNLEQVSIADMQDTVKKYLNSKQLLTLRIGRVGETA